MIVTKTPKSRFRDLGIGVVNLLLRYTAINKQITLKVTDYTM